MLERFLAAVSDPHLLRPDLADRPGQLVPVGMVGDGQRQLDAALPPSTVVLASCLRFSTTEMAWNDMAVATRTVGLLRVIDLLRSEHPTRAASLAEAAAEHAQWLAHDRNYMPGHDHGLFSDTALEYASRVLHAHTLAERWRLRARERMASTLQAVVCESEGTVLEHSPAYTEKVAELLDLDLGGGQGLQDGVLGDLVRARLDGRRCRLSSDG